MARKRKGTKKNKDKNLENHRFIFTSDTENYTSFAAGVFQHSAIRFDIPKNFVSILNDRKINYGCPNFYLVMTRHVINSQIVLRYELHGYFQEQNRSNKLDSFSKICNAFSGAISYARKDEKDIVQVVVNSLAVGCELIIFLHSIGFPFDVTDLAKYWFKDFVREVKKLFEEKGGMNLLHQTSSKGYCGRSPLDDKHDEYIKQNCRSYKTSAENPELMVNFYLAQCEGLSMDPDLVLGGLMDMIDEKNNRDSLSLSYAEKPDASMSVLTSEPHKVSGRDISLNTGIAIPKHDFLWIAGGSVAKTPSPDLRLESSEKSVNRLPQHEDLRQSFGGSIDLLSISSRKKARRKKTSVQLKMETTGENFLSLERGLGQTRLDTPELDMRIIPSFGIPPHEDLLPSRDVPVADTQSQNLTRASPQESVMRHKETSNQLNKQNRANISRLEEDLAQMNSDKFEDLLERFRHPFTETPFQNFSGQRTQKSVMKHTGTSDEHGRENRKVISSSVEQCLGQLRLDSKSTEQSSEKMPIPSVSRFLKPYQDLPNVKPKETLYLDLPSVKPIELSKKFEWISTSDSSEEEE